MKELVKYAAFLLEHQLEAMAAAHLQKAKADKFRLLHTQRSDAQQTEDLISGYKELLRCLQHTEPHAYVTKIMTAWHHQEIPGISLDQIGLHDLIQFIGFEKHSFISFIPAYTQDIDTILDIVQELAVFFDGYREKAYETFIDKQNQVIRRERDLIKNIINTSKAGIYALDKDLKVLVWNETLVRRHGIAKDIILGKPYIDFFEKDSIETELSAISRANEGDSSHLLIQNTLQQEHHYYEIDVVPLRENDGCITGTLAFSTDVSEQHAAMEKLKAANEKLSAQQEEMYQMNTMLEEKLDALESTQKKLEQSQRFIESIADTSPDFIGVFNLKERRNVYVNKGVAKFLGIEEHLPLKESYDYFQKMIHPDDVVAVESFIEEYLHYTGQAPREIEYRVKNYTGSYRWMRVTFNVLTRSPEGLPVEVVGISRDVTDRKRQKQELEEGLNYYLTLLDDFPALIWRSNKEAACDYFNHTWLAYTGRTLAQEQGNSWTEGVHPDDFQRCLDVYLSNFRARTPFEMEYRLRRHDGTYRWIADIGKPIHNLQGEFQGFLGACFDIQDRKDAEQQIQNSNHELAAALEELKSAEEQLRATNVELERRVQARTQELAESELEVRTTLDRMIILNNELAERENFLNNVIDQSPLSTWIADAFGTQIRVNQACTELFDIPDKDFGIGKYNILKDEFLLKTPHHQDIVEVFQKGKVARFEIDYDMRQVKHIHLPYQENLYIRCTIFPIKNSEGEVTHAVIQHENLTQKRQAELALRHSEEQLRLITDALPVLISYVNAAQEFIFVNQAYTSWFGKKKEEVIGQHIRNILGQQAYERMKAFITRALAGEEVKYDTFMPYIYGEGRDVMGHFVPHWVEGQVKGFFAIVSDVSTLRKAQADLSKRNSELLKINTDLDNFIYTASHDLKAPIANIEGLMQTLIRNYSPEMQASTHVQRITSMIADSIERFKITIQHLTEVSKLQKENEQDVLSINLQTVVHDVILDVSSLIEATGAKIDANIPHELNIHFSQKNLRSIVYNLLSNAIKYYSPERTPIVQIHAAKEDGYVVFSVQDNGLGIDDLNQKKLFSMFKRFHTHVEGSGIGLYMVKKIIENSGGHIEVESQLGVGSTFTVYFQQE